MRDKLLNSVKQVVEEELQRTYTEYGFGDFNSNHEAYAVIKEEIEEARIELDRAEQRLRWAWEIIKKNENPKESIEKIRLYGIYLACEAIQIAAVAEKYITSLKKQREDENHGNKI
ncbi:hypothetical protein NBE98_09795 [Clostridium swellfunianum]|uniref:hypothetical protein n=1 Tax=Clostridium swellfunianum TaxID=1367462 RepID=UPI00202E83D9|nr:hypothetical protein [Clostridium swellfunianum]MCM0648666.1 hypothetical protein [Clostridium swellfunianum]